MANSTFKANMLQQYMFQTKECKGHCGFTQTSGGHCSRLFLAVSMLFLKICHFYTCLNGQVLAALAGLTLFPLHRASPLICLQSV